MPEHPRATERHNRLLRTHVTTEQLGRLRALAAERDLSVSALVRQAIGRVLSTPHDREALGVMAALSALVAAEHTRLLLETIVPEGRRRSQSLREAAAQAAEARLYDTQSVNEVSR